MTFEKFFHALHERAKLEGPHQWLYKKALPDIKTYTDDNSYYLQSNPPFSNDGKKVVSCHLLFPNTILGVFILQQFEIPLYVIKPIKDNRCSALNFSGTAPSKSFILFDFNYDEANIWR